MENNLLITLKSKFQLAFSEKWAGRPIIEPIYDCIEYEQTSNTLSGRIQFNAKGRKTGEDVILLEDHMPIIKCYEELEDWIAAVFSKLLMQHQRWPK